MITKIRSQFSMAFNPQVQEKPKYDVIDEGLYAARCARIIELGVQADKYGEKPRVLIGFTLPESKIEIDGEEKQRFMWANNFGLNQTNNKDSTLMKYVNAIDGTVTHLKELLGKPCMVEVKHSEPKADGTVYANIVNVTKPLNGLSIDNPDIDTYMYEFDNGEDEVFELLSEYRQEQIRKAVNFDQ